MLLDFPYAERQKIVVVDDRVYEAQQLAERQAEEQKSMTKQGVDWNEITKLALKILTGGLYYELAKVVIQGITQLRNHGIKVRQVGRSEASQLRFPPGHPRDGVLYVGHPATPSVYYTIAQFHRLTFEHKFAEAVSLIESLGATEIMVEHVSGWSKEFSIKMSAALPQAGAGVTFGHNGESDSHLLFKAELEGTSKPAIPDNMVWFEYEPMWQQLAQSRVKFGLKNFSLSIQYEDDFGVNAGLKATVKGVGLDLGGNFEDYQSTVWKMEGKFAKTNTNKEVFPTTQLKRRSFLSKLFS